MKLDDLVMRKSEWTRGEGPRSNIVMSTRVRIARNVAGHLFCSRADEKQKKELLDMVSAALRSCPMLKHALSIRMKDIDELDRHFLVERHLMSPEHMEDVKHKGLVVEGKEIISVMINEEDHIRLQVLQSGFNIMEAWRIVDEVDTELSKFAAFDYSNRFGYLTSCPTNTGTGLRASVMVHLPALVATDQIDNVYEAISKLGLTIRGFYGEGTEAAGDFFQVSNQVALGRSEIDILDNLERIINKIISREEATRHRLLSSSREQVSDRVSRSMGTLESARIITSSETVKLLSSVRFGIDLGLVKGLTIPDVNEILIQSQPAHLQKIYKIRLDPMERDIKRADLIKEKLNKKLR